MAVPHPFGQRCAPCTAQSRPAQRVDLFASVSSLLIDCRAWPVAKDEALLDLYRAFHSSVSAITTDERGCCWAASGAPGEGDSGRRVAPDRTVVQGRAGSECECCPPLTKRLGGYLLPATHRPAKLCPGTMHCWGVCLPSRTSALLPRTLPPRQTSARCGASYSASNWRRPAVLNGSFPPGLIPCRQGQGAVLPAGGARGGRRSPGLQVSRGPARC